MHGGKTRDKIGALAGVSGRTVEKIAKVVEAAEAEPERYGKLLADMDRTGQVNGVYKRLRVIQQAEQLRAAPPPLPGGPYRVIVADPPWPYEKRTEDPSNRATYDYPAMSIAAICALPVRSLADDDSILWLWTTNHHMREAFDVVDAWGFEQKTILTWAKDRFGTGDWLRGQTEHVLFAVRGRPIVTLTNESTRLDAPVGAHSAKPEAFFCLVERTLPGLALCRAVRPPAAGRLGLLGQRSATPPEGRRMTPRIGMTQRRRLPNRREAVTETIEFAAGDGRVVQYEATIGFGELGRPKEIFLFGAKAGTDMAAVLADTAVALSVALQHGVTAEAMAASISRVEPA